MIAYCVKCKEKREMVNPQATYTSSGTPGTRGQCPVCGTGMFRMGETPAHANIPKPKVTARPKRKKASRKRGGKLVIVESPAKARTIGKFLGPKYRVKASIGHVRDLLKSRLSVDVENDFQPQYRVPNEKRDTVKELRKEVEKAAEVYLATDPDREGEAIAWHLLEAAQIPEEIARRVVFHEITQDAVTRAFAEPRGINMELVNAQQARRILDRLVGYKISPLLWDKVRGRLSAGRVQTVALRLVVEREREIEAFVPEEYWSIEAELAKQDTRSEDPRPTFVASLHRIRGEQFELKTGEEAQQIVEDLEGAAYIVGQVRRRERRRRPSPPFTTSTLQQRASRRLGFNARRTMRVAQQLYEGVDLGEGGPVGLITYMRTDSVAVSKQAQRDARRYIVSQFGDEYLPPQPPVYKTKSKSAQEAHEAIRPTSVMREPRQIKKYLTRDQYRLYDLIWKRFVASQMADAVFDATSVDIDAGDPAKEMPYQFRVTGSVLKFAGFLAVYGRDPGDEDLDLPPLAEGEELDLIQLLPQQHFTQPPPRYSEATLVKALEEYGIGRPSTYAPIISTIQNRGYVETVDKRLKPTRLGFIVNDLLIKHFPDIFDVGFTAQMEEELDQIARGEREWVPVLREFYIPFEKDLKRAEAEMEKVEVENEPTGELCPECGQPLIIRFGRYGRFIGCSGFPECKYTAPYLDKIGVECPQCGGDLVEKKTRKGRTFYGCANYPECDFASWQRPLPQPCPNCQGLLVQKGKDKAQCLACEQWYALDDVQQEASEEIKTPDGREEPELEPAIG
ncbi:MAG: type I DNA topoisomerase [Chloroflexi bacterium]|nr:MAG: type I DNA topoisomerase [Chloroflexota bacterium]